MTAQRSTFTSGTATGMTSQVGPTRTVSRYASNTSDRRSTPSLERSTRLPRAARSSVSAFSIHGVGRNPRHLGGEAAVVHFKNPANGMGDVRGPELAVVDLLGDAGRRA